MKIDGLFDYVKVDREILFSCGHCSHIHSVVLTDLPEADEKTEDHLPDGWTISIQRWRFLGPLEARLVCDRHEIAVTRKKDIDKLPRHTKS